MKNAINLIAVLFLAVMHSTSMSQEQTFPVTAASFPKEVIPVEAGKIEITAFINLSEPVLNNEPFLFWITDGTSTYRLGFHGNSGILGEVGDGFLVKTYPEYYYDLLFYKDLFDIHNWHVFTLQWDINGIPGIDDGTRKVAVFVDGIHRSTMWEEPNSSTPFPALTAGSFNLIAQNIGGEIRPKISVRDLVIYDRNNNIILKNSLASVEDIENSIIGPDGQFNGGGNAEFTFYDGIQTTALTAHPVFSNGLPSTPLVLSCPTNIQRQHNKIDYYYIPALQTTGIFSNVEFSIIGGTIRSGYGLDASGYFSPGTSTILWKATDKEGDLITCQTTLETTVPADNDPGWAFSAPISQYLGGGALIPGGDINGDGFKDVVVYYYDTGDSPESYDRKFGTTLTFFGKSAGVEPIPKLNHLRDFYGTTGYGIDYILNSAGDVNGDGFDDLITGRYFGHDTYLFYGAQNGLNPLYAWQWSDVEDMLGFSIIGKHAGDLNGDGFDDVVHTAVWWADTSKIAFVFYGSSAGLKSTYDWKFSLPGYVSQDGLAVGDINNDGNDDLVIPYVTNFFALFMGSPSGLGNTPLLVKKYPDGYQTQITGGGDINGDHFNDIVVSGYSAGDSSSYILYGTALGLDTTGVKIEYLRNPSFIGDINADGFAEVVGNGLIHYGSAKGFYPIPDALVQHLTVQVQAAGDVNNDGFGDIMGRSPEEMLLYYGFAGSKPYAEQMVLCGTKDKQYSLPELYVNLPGATITFNITGATLRTGSGTDASGSFNNGTSYIAWKVTDQFNKEYVWTTTVVVYPYVEVQIVDAYAVRPGGEPNTIYLGYGKQYLTLKSKVSGGAGKYSYKWSTGSTAKSINVSPTNTGTYWYTLWITDGNNCRFADSIKVTVMDVRCDQKVTSVLNKYLPGWQSWNYLQGFIKNNSFIKVCVPLNGKRISTCVPVKMVAPLLAKGATLGECPINNQLFAQSEPYKDIKDAQEFSIKVSPNPSPAGFNLEVQGNINEPLLIIIRDPVGRTVQRINCAYASRVAIGAKLQKGIYFVEVIQGNQRKVVNIVKL